MRMFPRILGICFTALLLLRVVLFTLSYSSSESSESVKSFVSQSDILVSPGSPEPEVLNSFALISDDSIDAESAGSFLLDTNATLVAVVGEDIQRPKKHVVIIVPYRDRDDQIVVFLAHMNAYFTYRRELSDVDLRFDMIVIEQFDNIYFNRAWLFNVGFLSSQLGDTCVVMLDVDSLADFSVDFTDCDPPTHFASNTDRHPFYSGFMGIALGMKASQWKTINGAGNHYWGWGKEDDDLGVRLRKNRLRVREANKDKGIFKTIPNNSPKESFDDAHKQNLVRHASSQTDGISTTTYNVAYNFTSTNETCGTITHWIGVSMFKLPDISSVSLNFEPGACHKEAPHLEEIPKSINDLYASYGCERTESLKAFMVSLDSGEAVEADTWYKLIRWLRTRNGRPSSIIFTSQLHLELVPRTHPVCVLEDKGVYSFSIGAVWCLYRHNIASIAAYLPEDEVWVKHPERTIRVCYTESKTGSLFMNGADCKGEGILVDKDGTGQELCVGRSIQIGYDRVNLGNNCTADGWEHKFTFRSVDSEESLMLATYSQADGSASLKNLASNPLLLLRPSVNPESHVNYKSVYIDTSQNEVKPGRDEYLVKLSSSTGAVKGSTFCLSATSDGVCLSDGNCESSICSNGINVESFGLLDLSIDILAKELRLKKDSDRHRPIEPPEN